MRTNPSESNTTVFIGSILALEKAQGNKPTAFAERGKWQRSSIRESPGENSLGLDDDKPGGGILVVAGEDKNIGQRHGLLALHDEITLTDQFDFHAFFLALVHFDIALRTQFQEVSISGFYAEGLAGNFEVVLPLEDFFELLLQARIDFLKIFTFGFVAVGAPDQDGRKVLGLGFRLIWFGGKGWYGEEECQGKGQSRYLHRVRVVCGGITFL